MAGRKKLMHDSVMLKIHAEKSLIDRIDRELSNGKSRAMWIREALEQRLQREKGVQNGTND